MLMIMIIHGTQYNNNYGSSAPRHQIMCLSSCHKMFNITQTAKGTAAMNSGMKMAICEMTMTP